jgi:hypothetical protein
MSSLSSVDLPAPCAIVFRCAREGRRREHTFGPMTPMRESSCYVQA